MHNIGILYHPQKAAAKPLAYQVGEWLTAQHRAVWIAPGRDEPNMLAPVAQSDLLIVLGGDGSMLRAARLAAPSQTPLLGINEIAQSLDVSHFVVQKAVSFLMDQKILTEVHEDQHDFNGELKVLLTRALKEGEEVMIIQGFLGVHKLVQSFDASPIFREIFAPLSKK